MVFCVRSQEIPVQNTVAWHQALLALLFQRPGVPGTLEQAKGGRADATVPAHRGPPQEEECL